jgi:hypothetical protein
LLARFVLFVFDPPDVVPLLENEDDVARLQDQMLGLGRRGRRQWRRFYVRSRACHRQVVVVTLLARLREE